MNTYISVFTLSWNVNTNMSLCISIHEMIYYITKYISKVKVKFELYKKLFTNAIKRQKHKKLPFLSVTMRVINQLIGECNWFTQEVAYHLLRIQLGNCICDFTTVNFLSLNKQNTFAESENSQFQKKEQFWLEKYMMHLLYTLCLENWLENVTLFKFV